MILLCLTACLFQLQESAVQYFEYKTVSKVSIQMGTERNPPAITLCPLVKNLSYKTLAEAFAFSFNTSELVISREHNSGRMEHFLKSFDRCTSFYPSIRHVRTSNPQETIYTVILSNRTQKYGHYDFIMHDADHQIHGKYDSYTFMLPEKYNYIIVFFTAFENKFLPAPYETHCRDYSATTKFQSQDHCIESCAIRQSLDQRGIFPLFVSPAYDPLPVPYDKRFNLTILTMLRQSCKNFCLNQDCDTLSFTTRDISITNPERNPRIAISDSTDLSFITESVAATDSVTYATKLLGCIAFWTGVCPFGVFFSQKILSFLKRPAFPQVTFHRCYFIVIVLLSAAAYVYQVFPMADEYFKYGTANTIAFHSIVGQGNVSLTFCHKYTSNRSNQISELNISNPFSKYAIDDRSFIPPHQGRSQRAPQEEFTLIHYQIFGLLCHSIRVNKTLIKNPHKLPEDVKKEAEKKSQFSGDSHNIQIGISPLLQNILERLEVQQVYLSMSSVNDMLYNPNNNFVPMDSIGYVGKTSNLDRRVVVKKNMPAPYDTQCMHHVDGDRIISSNDCFYSCYSSRMMKKYDLFPFDTPRRLMAGNASFEFPFLGQADKQMGEEDKQKCSRRCGNDCMQVNYYLRELSLSSASKLRTFVISGPDEEITITHSALISFWDLVSVMLNGASFYFSFCPATLLLSHWLWSRVTPVRVAPEQEQEETEMYQLPVASVQQRDDPDEESAPVSEPKPSVNHRSGQVSISSSAYRLQYVV